ncbi:MAG: hypothetical protein S0880_36405 [Actinomycetota bacterium]|nr:hypothetical protein [Actinomycetota bacterium]
MNLDERFRRVIDDGTLDLPPLGGGHTPARLRALAAVARADTALGRLAEAHADAVQILAEAGRPARPGARYGVWAAEDPSAVLTVGGRDGRMVLDGTKVFCTGAGIVDRALVTVPGSGAGPRLVDVDLRAHPDRVTIDGSAWITPAFADTSTATIHLDQLPLDDDAVVGPPGWYLDRPGFWHGACGPAACWAGGATGLVDDAIARAAERGPQPHRDAAVGALSALATLMEATLDHAGAGIDRDPSDVDGAARVRALETRHLIERACTEVIDRHGRAFGPRPLAFDADTHRRVLEVQLYIRQSHAERDLEALGRAVRERHLDRPGDPGNSGTVHS